MSRTITHKDKHYVSLTKTELKAIVSAMAEMASMDDLDDRTSRNLQLMQKAILVRGKNPTRDTLDYFLKNCHTLEIDTRYLKRDPSNKGERSLVAFEIGDENGSQWAPKPKDDRVAFYNARREFCLHLYQKSLEALGFNETTVPNPMPGALNEAFEEVAKPYFSALADLQDEAKQDRMEYKDLIVQVGQMRSELVKLATDVREKWYESFDRRITRVEENINLLFSKLGELDQPQAA